MKGLSLKIGGFRPVSKRHSEIFDEIDQNALFRFALAMRLCMMPRHSAREAA
jgi:hypothetical protein